MNHLKRNLCTTIFSILLLSSCGSSGESAQNGLTKGDSVENTEISDGTRAVRKEKRTVFKADGEIDYVKITVWYDNDQVALVDYQLEGFRQGDMTEWYIDGQIASSYTWDEGFGTGVHRVWYPGGEQKYYSELVCTMSGSTAKGSFVSWHENGVISSVGKYNYDEKVGTWLYFDEEGNVIRKEEH